MIRLILVVLFVDFVIGQGPPAINIPADTGFHGGIEHQSGDNREYHNHGVGSHGSYNTHGGYGGGSHGSYNTHGGYGGGFKGDYRGGPYGGRGGPSEGVIIANNVLGAIFG